MGGDMIDWMRRLLSPRGQSVRPPDAPAEPAVSGAPGPDPAAEILEAIQKASRTQARLGARLEALESKIEGGFTDLRTAIAGQAAATRSNVRWDDLLDALDLLEEAIRSIGHAQGREAADGLSGIASRIDRFLAQFGLVRVGAPDRLTDGKLFRVVGTEQLPGLADGVIARLVRSAVLEGDRVVREGEVTINRRSS
jgi:molecular chaperone GrpE (heat shock protein)